MTHIQARHLRRSRSPRFSVMPKDGRARSSPLAHGQAIFPDSGRSLQADWDSEDEGLRPDSSSTCSRTRRSTPRATRSSRTSRSSTTTRNRAAVSPRRCSSGSRRRSQTVDDVQGHLRRSSRRSPTKADNDTGNERAQLLGVAERVLQIPSLGPWAVGDGLDGRRAHELCSRRRCQRSNRRYHS